MIGKSKRIISYIMGGEVYEFMDEFDDANFVKMDLERMMSTKMSVTKPPAVGTRIVRQGAERRIMYTALSFKTVAYHIGTIRSPISNVAGG